MSKWIRELLSHVSAIVNTLLGLTYENADALNKEAFNKILQASLESLTLKKPPRNGISEAYQLLVQSLAMNEEAAALQAVDAWKDSHKCEATTPMLSVPWLLVWLAPLKNED